MEYKYQFAGIEILVQIPDEKKYTDEYRLEEFRTEKLDNPYIYKFELVEQLSKPIGICVMNCAGSCIYEHNNQRIRYVGSVENTLDGAYIRVEQSGKNNTVQLLKEKYPKRIGAKTVLNSIEVEHLIAQAGGAILHCSYIEMDGKAVLFTAPSETGKSTQADLWNQFRGAEIINGDRAALRIIDGEIIVEGIPFSGSSSYCKNKSLPLEAIVYLSQAPESTISRLQGYKAFSKIWEGVSINTWEKQDVETISYIVQEIVKNIPVFHLACTPDESAILVLEQALGKRR